MKETTKILLFAIGILGFVAIVAGFHRSPKATPRLSVKPEKTTVNNPSTQKQHSFNYTPIKNKGGAY